MARLLTFVGAVILFAAASYAFGVSRWTLGVGVMAVSGAVWFASKCAHRGPLGLLPPVVGDDGVPQPARWFCPDCGAEWAASFDHDHRPVARFTGYDEAKAMVAARRANELEDQRRRLALARAGLTHERPLGTSADVIAMRVRSGASRNNAFMKPAS